MHCPTKSRAGGIYRGLFVILGLVLCVLTLWQSQRSSDQQMIAKEEANRVALKSEADMNLVKGQLLSLGTAILKLDERNTDPALRELANAIGKMAQNIGKPILVPPKATAATAAPRPKVFNKCDANGDGAIDNKDYDEVINQILARVPCATGDINGDGNCDVIDLQVVKNSMLGAGVCD